MNMPKPAPPPALAQRLLAWASDTSFRDCLLGDLHEEFLARGHASLPLARRWYWSQAVRSIPGLLMFRIRSYGVGRLALLAAAYALALVAVSTWDHWVSRQVVQNLVAQENGWPLIVFRTIYFGLYSVGGLIAGLLAAALIFDPQRSTRANVVRIVAPLAVVAGSLLLWQVLAEGRYEQLGYLVFRVTLLTFMLTLGAAAYSHWRSGKYRC